MDVDLIFSCFGEIRGNGLLLASNSPAIKFKVSDNRNDLIVGFTMELVEGNNAVIRVLVNEKKLCNFFVEQADGRKKR
ncbi:MAG: hypothetical protein LBS23_00060 [Holosporaceae bacterium]|jgi:hypothetical protein|nr:hypothetical protein [Holosporaceae bacterium]